MSTSDNNPSRSDALLSAKLRDLGRSSPMAASPEVEGLLVNAFRRHRRRRKVLRMVPIFALLVVIVGAALWRWSGSDYRPTAKQMKLTSPGPVAQPANSVSEAFVPLPSFAFSKSNEDLRIIRVEMPVSSLRLLGARVNDDLITQRVVADLLIGVDGTPYAFRLIS
jgi:hypothetical protein